MASSIIPNINSENINSCEKYFKGTKTLKDNFSDKELKIKSNMREFKSIEKNSGYDEIFLNEDSEIFGGITNHISFLYPPKIRGNQNRIGFRYYKEDPLSQKNDIPYFTLVKVQNTKFIILEKGSQIKDVNGNSFVIKDLDCFDIILNIIKEKIKSDDDFLTYPNSTCEILGFIYACKSSLEKKKNNIELLHPFFPCPFIKETFIEEETDIDPSKYYLEPILYNDHISLLLFYYKKRRANFYCRKNIIFDMSSFHYKTILKNDPTFPDDMKSYLIKFPESPIQIGSSCSMWFYASMLFLLEEKIEMPLNKNSLYVIIKKIYDLFVIEQKDIFNIKIIEREKENIDKNMFVSYKLALRTFIDVDSTLDQLFCLKNIGSVNLGEYQKIFIELKNKLNLLKINNIYYSKIFNAIIVSEEEMKKLKSLFSQAEVHFASIINIKKKILQKPDEYPQRDLDISIKDFTATIKELKSKLSEKDEKYSLYSKHKLHKLFFDNSDVFLNIFDN
jgi:hypothetical protein